MIGIWYKIQMQVFMIPRVYDRIDLIENKTGRKEIKEPRIENIDIK